MMYSRSNRPILLVSALLILFVLGPARVAIMADDNKADEEVPTASADESPDLMAVAPPPFSDKDIFPCSSCHADLETNPNRRVLESYHEQIALKHDEKNRWCLDCHDAKNRDKLHMASGELVDFTESYKLCGQCHGLKLRDWKAGVHGRRTGSWSGKKQYLLCVHCHNSHSPRFKPLNPEPPPVRPEELN